MAKRSQIEVGQEWAYQRSRDHYIGNYGYEKVVIKAVEGYERGYNGPVKTNKGQGVWIEGPRFTPSVVQLSQLFIPWAEYEVQKAEYDAQKKINDAKSVIAKAEREKFQQNVYAPALSEFQSVIQDATGKHVSGYGRIDQLPIEVIQLIVEAIKIQKVA